MKLSLLALLLSLTFFQNASSSAPITTENVGQLAELGKIVYAKASIRDLAFQPKGNVLAAIKLSGGGTLDGEVVFLDSTTFKEISPSSEIAPATTLTFSPDGSLFATGNESGQIVGYSMSTFQQTWDFQGSLDIVNDLAISQDNSHLGATFATPTLITEDDAAFRSFTLPSGKEELSHPLDDTQYGIYGGGVTFDDINQFVFFSTTNMTTGNGVVRAWEIASDTKREIGEGQNSKGHDLLYDPQTGSLLYIGLEGVHVTNLKLDNSAQDYVLSSVSKGESITRIALAPNAPILAVGFFKDAPRPDGGPSATNAGIIRLYNTQTGDELLSIDLPEGAITSLAFSPDGTLLASGGTDGTVRLWGVPEK